MSEKVTAIEEYAAMQAMIKMRGWELLMKRFTPRGDDLLTKILNEGTPCDLRRLYVFQLKALGALSEILEEVKQDAEQERDRNKEPKPINLK